VEVDDETFVVADIPGLIEGAHQGVGLGHEFLRHVERTRVLLQVVDTSGQEDRDPLEDYRIIKAELTAHDPALAQRPRLVVLNKMDLPEARANLARLEAAARADEAPVFAVSAATGQGLRPLLYQVAELLRAHPRPAPEETESRPTADPSDQDERLWRVERLSRHHFRVTGGRIERLVRMTDFANDEAAARLQRVLEASGISPALLKAGIVPGDVVHIAGHELVWDEEALEASQREQAARAERGE
jgi:GTP-binding protein